MKRQPDSRMLYTALSASAITEKAAAAGRPLLRCDSMAVLEDTNLLHRGGRDGLEYVRDEAARISAMPPDERIDALHAFDRELISRGLSPGGSADMLALAFLLERWKTISAFLSIEEREDR